MLLTRKLMAISENPIYKPRFNPNKGLSLSESVMFVYMFILLFVYTISMQILWSQGYCLFVFTKMKPRTGSGEKLRKFKLTHK